MKAVLKPRRPSPAEALAIATSTAPQQPSAQLPPGEDTATTLNLRVRRTTVTAIEAAARSRGLTMKQVVCQALEAAGIPVAPADLENRTPRRQ